MKASFARIAIARINRILVMARNVSSAPDCHGGPDLVDLEQVFFVWERTFIQHSFACIYIPCHPEPRRNMSLSIMKRARFPACPMGNN